MTENVHVMIFDEISKLAGFHQYDKICNAFYEMIVTYEV